MYTPIDRSIIHNFDSNAKTALNHNYRDFPLISRFFFFPLYLLAITRDSPKGDPVFISWGGNSVEEMLDSPSSSFDPDIVCFILYGLARALADFGLRLYRKRGLCAFRGKYSRCTSHPIPHDESWHTSKRSSGHILCGRLLRKRSHLIRSRPARSSGDPVVLSPHVRFQFGSGDCSSVLAFLGFREYPSIRLFNLIHHLTFNKNPQM